MNSINRNDVINEYIMFELSEDVLDNYVNITIKNLAKDSIYRYLFKKIIMSTYINEYNLFKRFVMNNVKDIIISKSIQDTDENNNKYIYFEIIFDDNSLGISYSSVLGNAISQYESVYIDLENILDVSKYESSVESLIKINNKEEFIKLFNKLKDIILIESNAYYELQKIESSSDTESL